MTICCLCEIDRKKAVEHVFPLWLQKHLDIRTENVEPTLVTESGELLTRGPYNLKNFLAGKICIECNTGWMCDMESATKPVLVPLIERTKELCDLSETERRMVSSWAFKTALTLNIASNFEGSIPRHHYTGLFANHEWIPNGTTVLGRLACGEKPFDWIESHLFKVRIPEGTEELALIEELKRSTYLTAIQAGQLQLAVVHSSISGYRLICDEELFVLHDAEIRREGGVFVKDRETSESLFPVFAGVELEFIVE